MTELALDDATRAAVGRWVDEYADTVVKTAYYYLGDRDAAKDVAQEVFLKCLSSRVRPEDVRQPKAWLVRMTRNACTDWRRANRNAGAGPLLPLEWLDGRTATAARATGTSAAGIACTASGTMGAAAAEEADSVEALVLWDAVAQLPSIQKETLLLFYYFGFGSREIAVVLRRPEGTVRSILARARAALKRRLEDPSDEGR